MFSKCSFAWGLALGVVSLPAYGHVKIISHPMRNGPAFIKEAPCGKDSDARGTDINVFLSGSTITLRWDEFTFHTGYFRIAFDDDGDEFPEPADYFDFFTPAPAGTTIMHDGLFDGHTRNDGPIFSFDVTLPDIECDNCTLQLTQIMTDKPPYVPNTNDLYYNCLDVVLTRDPSLVPPPPTIEFGGGSCSVTTPTQDDAPQYVLGGVLALLCGLLYSFRTRQRGRHVKD